MNTQADWYNKNCSKSNQDIIKQLTEEAKATSEKSSSIYTKCMKIETDTSVCNTFEEIVKDDIRRYKSLIDYNAETRTKCEFYAKYF